jgi:hypothetical protein
MKFKEWQTKSINTYDVVIDDGTMHSYALCFMTDYDRNRYLGSREVDENPDPRLVEAKVDECMNDPTREARRKGIYAKNY